MCGILYVVFLWSERLYSRRTVGERLRMLYVLYAGRKDVVQMLHYKNVCEFHEFLEHLNSIHDNIQFSMEFEEKKQFPFLGVINSLFKVNFSINTILKLLLLSIKHLY